MTAESLGVAVERSRGVGGATLCEAFQSTVARLPDAVAVRTWDGEIELTWREYSQHASRIAAGLAGLGVTRGETVALMMSNRPEFYLCDTAALHLGATPFSIYNTSAPEQITQLLSNASNRVLIDAHLHLGNDRAFQGSRDHPCLDARNDQGLDEHHARNARGPAALLSAGRTHRRSHDWSLPGDDPLSCVADAGSLPAALRDVRPTLWIAVPRVWEKLQAALETAIACEPDEERRIATHDAIALGERKVRAEQAAIAGDGDGPDAGLLDDYARADELILRALRARVGLDQAHYCCSGAAPASRRMLEFFGSIGLEVCEGWGMTELSGVASACPPGAAKHGTVGPPVPGLEVRLAPDGELLCRGATIMRGYRGAPEQTAETIDADGWLHTGDIAHIDDDGYLRIVDRKKELIINAAGKNMSPANIEAALKSSSPLIGQCVCVGDRRPYNVALIVLDPDTAAAFARERQLDCSIAALAADERLQAAVSEAVERANTTLSRIEQIKRFAILPHDWLPDSDELTPMMKLKRKPIAQKYEREIDALYETRPAENAAQEERLRS